MLLQRSGGDDLTIKKVLFFLLCSVCQHIVLSIKYFQSGSKSKFPHLSLMIMQHVSYISKISFKSSLINLQIELLAKLHLMYNICPPLNPKHLHFSYFSKKTFKILNILHKRPMRDVFFAFLLLVRCLYHSQYSFLFMYHEMLQFNPF